MKSIRTKVIMCMLIVALLGVGIFLGSFYVLSTSILEQEIVQNLNNETETASNMITDWIEFRIEEMERFARIPLIKAMNMEKIVPYLQNETEIQSDVYDTIFIATEAGNIKVIQDKIVTTKEKVEKSKDIIDVTKKSLIKTKKSNENNVESVIESIKTLDQLLMEIEEVNKYKDDMINFFADISAVAEESAAGTQEISATIEEQSAVIEEIAKMAEKLSEIANDLNKEVEKFKV